MITASHNPKDDNGYKVYWSNACQVSTKKLRFVQSFLQLINPAHRLFLLTTLVSPKPSGMWTDPSLQLPDPKKKRELIPTIY